MKSFSAGIDLRRHNLTSMTSNVDPCTESAEHDYGRFESVLSQLLGRKCVFEHVKHQDLQMLGLNLNKL